MDQLAGLGANWGGLGIEKLELAAQVWRKAKEDELNCRASLRRFEQRRFGR